MELEAGCLPEALQKKGLSEEIAEICRRNDIVFMAIFGSFARGEQKKTSDVDVAIEFDESRKKSLLDLIRVEKELTRAFGKKVDLGIFGSLSPYVAEDVRREMRVIYAKR